MPPKWAAAAKPAVIGVINSYRISATGGKTIKDTAKKFVLFISSLQLRGKSPLSYHTSTK